MQPLSDSGVLLKIFAQLICVNYQKTNLVILFLLKSSESGLPPLCILSRSETAIQEIREIIGDRSTVKESANWRRLWGLTILKSSYFWKFPIIMLGDRPTTRQLQRCWWLQGCLRVTQSIINCLVNAKGGKGVSGNFPGEGFESLKKCTDQNVNTEAVLSWKKTFAFELTGVDFQLKGWDCVNG